MIRLITGLLVIFAFIYVLVAALGNIVLAKAFEQALGVPTKAGRLHFDPLKSEIGIYNLRIDNPAGFQEKRLGTISEIFASYDLRTIPQKKIHLKELRFHLDQITIERNQEGKVNLLEVAARTQKEQETVAGSESVEEPATGTPWTIQMDKVVLSLGTARYVDSSSGDTQAKEFPIEVYDIVLEDVSDPAIVVQEVAMKTLQKVGLNAVIPDLNQLSVSVSAQLSKTFDELREGISGWMKSIQTPTQEAAPVAS